MAISKSTKRRVITALSSQPAGNEILGSLGASGGFSVNSDASLKVVQGDISVAGSPGHAGAYRVYFPHINDQIKSIDWFDVSGFTPRNPNGVETCAALVTGYNQDATTHQWYVTVQIVALADWSLQATPPQNFVIGIRAAFSLKPQANAL